MNSARNFLAWLVEDVNDVSAETGSPRDELLMGFAANGFLKVTDTAHGTTFYEISPKWMTALSSTK